MEHGRLRRAVTLLVHVVIGWALCGAIIMIGRELTSMHNTLTIHLVGAPLIFAAISLIYFRKFHYTSPFPTAVIFVAAVILLDLCISAALIEKSFAMFASATGTWIPFALILLSTYLTGLYAKKHA